MPIKDRVRVKLPGGQPLFRAKLRELFAKANVLNDDDDHVVLEFDRVEDAQEALRQPVIIQGVTLEMVPLAAERVAAPPRSSVCLQGADPSNLREMLSAQGNTPTTEKSEEGASGQPQDMNARLRKMGARPLVGCGRSSMPPPLPSRKPPPLLNKKPATSRHSSQVSGPGEGDSNRPTGAPGKQRPASAIPTSNTAKPEQRQSPPVAPRQSLLPPAARESIFMWKSSDFDEEEKENNAAPNTDDNFNRLRGQNDNTYLEIIEEASYLNPLANMLQPTAPSTLDDADQHDVLKSCQLFGPGYNLSMPQEHAPPPPQDQPRHGDVSKPPAASESPALQPPSSAEDQARLSRPPPNRPLPDIPIDPNAAGDEERSPHIYDSLPDCSLMFGYGPSSRPSDPDKDLEDIRYSLRLEDDDGGDNDDENPYMTMENIVDRNPKKGAGDTISRQLDLSDLHLKLLGAMKKLSSKPGVEVQRTPDGKVILMGEEKAVLQMEEAMRSEANSLRPVSHSMSRERLDLLQSKSNDAWEQLQRLSIRGTWVVHDGQVYVAGADDPATVFDVLENVCDTSTKSLKLEDVLLFGSPRHFKMGEAFEYLKKNQDNLLGTLGRDDDAQLTLSKKDGCHYVTVKGKTSEVESIIEIVRIRLENVTQEETVLRDAAVTSMWRNERSEEVMHEVEKKFSRYIITAEALPEEGSAPQDAAGNISGSDTRGDLSDDSSSDDEISNIRQRSPSPPAALSQAAKAEGSVLLVLPAMEAQKADLLEMHVDAVVHGTDDKLSFRTKLGEAMLKKLGPALQQMCTDYVRQRGKLPAGSVFCTDVGPGSKFTTVVHASLPKATNGFADGRLKDTVVEALKAAVAKGHHSVALPALGAHSCGFSPADAALSVLQGVAAFSQASHAHGLRKVTLCDMSEKTHAVFMAVLRELWALDTARLRASLKLNASLLLADSKLQKPGSKLPNVQLVLGSIQNQQADVIVNSTRPDLSLDSGSISKSLGRAAGRRLQAELQSKGIQELTPGKLCDTSGGDLRCKRVFHITLPKYTGDEERKVLERTLWLCLENAENARYSSIAFPPLCTGNLHFPPRVVMATFLQCVKSFRQKYASPNLKRVTLVVYPDGPNSIQPFREPMAEFIESDKIGKADPAPNERKVGQITVKMREGDITKQKTDAIVNGCQDDMNLEKGAISKAILKAAGQDLQAECNRLAAAMARDKVVVSGAGNLGCRKIIHVVTQPGADHWRAMWPKVFETCKTLNITSLAIPPIGAGQMKVTPWVMGGLLCEAIKKITSPGPLHTVRVVFPQKNMRDDFAQGFKDKEGNFGLPKPDMTTEEATLGCLSVTVAVGSITKETGDAIVNFCNADMNLSKGMIASTISNAAGPDLQRECNDKKADMQSQGVVVTLSGKLQCNKVIHLPRADSAAKLSESVKLAVCTAQNKNLDEISFPAPAIGGRFDPVKVAAAMFEGLKKAGSTRGRNVRVRLVLNSAQSVGAFVQQLRAQTKTCSLPTQMHPVYSDGRRMRREIFSDPGQPTRGLQQQEEVAMETCTLPVRIRVTGMGEEVKRVPNEVLKQCQVRVASPGQPSGRFN